MPIQLWNQILNGFRKILRWGMAPATADAVPDLAPAESVPSLPAEEPTAEDITPKLWNVAEAARLNKDGWSIRQLAKRYDRAGSFVHKHLRRHAEELRIQAEELEAAQQEAAAVITAAAELTAHQAVTDVEAATPEWEGDTMSESVPEGIWDGLKGLLEPTVTPAAPAVEPPAVEPEPLSIAVIAEPVTEPEPWVPDWEMETRADLPMRSAEDIRRLLQFETPEQTTARIQNDWIRYLHERAGRAIPNQQAAISHAGKEETGGVATWVKRR